MKTFEDDVAALYEKRLAKLDKKLEEVKLKYDFLDYGMRAYEKQDKVKSEIEDLKKKYSAFLSSQTLLMQLQMAKSEKFRYQTMAGELLSVIGQYDSVKMSSLKNKWKDLLQ